MLIIAYFQISELDENEVQLPTQKKTCSITSKLCNESSEKLQLSRNQFYLRKKKTIAVLKPIHCGTDTRFVNKDENISPVLNGLWTTFINTATNDQLKSYVEKSETCTKKIIPNIVKEEVKRYENSDANKTRSMRVLYEGGLISSRKYTKVRNSADEFKTKEKERKASAAEFMKGCKIPKLLPYKSLMSYIRDIDIGEIIDLEVLSRKFSLEPVPGMYRPLKPFLLRLADLYLSLDAAVPLLHWFHNEKNVFYIAVGADGAPFGRDDTATGTYNIHSITVNH